MDRLGFKREELVFLLFALPVLVLIISYFAAKIVKDVKQAYAASIGSRFFSGKERAVRLVLELAVFTGLALAFLEPVYGKTFGKETITETPHIVVLDVSKSSGVEDYPGNISRMEMSCLALELINQKYPASKQGLVLFSGSAHGFWPASDISAKEYLMEQMCRLQAIPGGGSNIIEALEIALDMAVEEGIKVVVLLSDGGEREDTNLPELNKVGAMYRQVGVKVLSLGVGTPQGGRVPIYDNLGHLRGYEKADGRVIISRLNSTVLKTIATATGGKYVPLSSPKDAVLLLEQEGELVVREIESIESQGRDIYYIPLSLALLCLILWVIFPNPRG